MSKPNRVLVMSKDVESLVLLAINRMGLPAPHSGDDLIIIPIRYEHADLTIVVMCQAQPSGWFTREKPVVSISFIEHAEEGGVARVHDTSMLSFPTSPHDMDFLMKFGARTKATAWMIAGLGGIGECLDFPGRPPGP